MDSTATIAAPASAAGRGDATERRRPIMLSRAISAIPAAMRTKPAARWLPPRRGAVARRMA
jgi:hypothetical protein